MAASEPAPPDSSRDLRFHATVFVCPALSHRKDANADAWPNSNDTLWAATAVARRCRQPACGQRLPARQARPEVAGLSPDLRSKTVAPCVGSRPGSAECAPDLSSGQRARVRIERSRGLSL